MPQHSEQKILPYTPAQLFALVADIERYPEFLPWCLAARIRSREADVITADLIIGYKAFREKFTSIVTLIEYERISVKYESGPLAHLNNEWEFKPHENSGCELSFFVDFGFKSSMLSMMMDSFFDKAFRKMVAAFEERAKELYG
jgi:coenzyme Q-binding protein COQ10